MPLCLAPPFQVQLRRSAELGDDGGDCLRVGRRLRIRRRAGVSPLELGDGRMGGGVRRTTCTGVPHS